MITKLNRGDAEEIAKIHANSLPDDFLPSLGGEFLKTFYKGLIVRPDVFGFVFSSRGKTAGFVVATENMERVFKSVLIYQFTQLLPKVLFSLFKNPYLLKNIFDTFFYTQKDKGPEAELIIIALESKYRGQGFGEKMVHLLDNEMRKRKIARYKLTVTQRNKKANAFYKKLGFRKYSDFRLYNKNWNVLVKEL